MKKLFFVLLAFTYVVFIAFLFTGCSRRATDERIAVDINMNNYWELMHVNVVHVNPTVGTRLQIFSEIEGATFSNVIVTYTIFPDRDLPTSETRIIRLDSNGVGQTNICQRAMPRITGISGQVII